MKNNELSTGDLFILLKGMIKQHETEKALKLEYLVEQRFEELWQEKHNLKDEIELMRDFSNMYFEDERDN